MEHEVSGGYVAVWAPPDGEAVATVFCTLNSGNDAMSSAEYLLTFAKLPGREFGPYGYREAMEQLAMGALIARQEARDALLDAFIARGEVTS